MGTFSRIRYVLAANVNALLEKAEDPEKLLRALIHEMEEAGEDARLAAADLLAEQQRLERVGERLKSETAEWQQRAERAVATEREDLARAALKAKAELKEALSATAAERKTLDTRLAQLETDMATLKGKLNEAKSRLKEMRATGRPGVTAAASAERPSRNERKMRQAFDRFERLQSQVERLEARVRSYEVGGTQPSPWATGMDETDPAIEEELAAIRDRISRKSGTAGSEGRAQVEQAEGTDRQ